MLLVEKTLIKTPADLETLDKKTTNIIFSNLDKGLCLFQIPDRFNHMKFDNLKKHKKNYKVGFLFDALTLVYPNLEKQKKAEIIAEEYHFWFTYRQFKTILDSYEENKGKYYSF